jgi:hypothetical protein
MKIPATKPIPRQNISRVTQEDITSNVVKNRHMAEPNTYIRCGLSSERPTIGASVMQGTTFFGTSAFFEYDTNRIYIWNPQEKVWKSILLP